MRILFLLLIIANLSLFAWHMQGPRDSDKAMSIGPQPVDANTPPLLLLSELPKQDAPAEAHAPREAALQEIPPDNAP